MISETTIDIPIDTYIDKFRNFLTSIDKYVDEINNAIIQRRRSICIDFPDLIVFDKELADLVIEKPKIAITAASEAIKQVITEKDPEFGKCGKPFYARFRKLPEIIPLRKLRSEYIDKLITIEGIVTRQTPPKHFLKKIVYRCSHCAFEIEVPQYYSIPPQQPKKCPRCSGTLTIVSEKCEYIDWQKIIVQEKPEELPPGQLPRSIEVILLDDLVDLVKPGDRVYVVGLLQVNVYEFKKNKPPILSSYIEANYIESQQKEFFEVEITPEDEKKILELASQPNIRDRIIKSIAPSIYGLEEVKEAIACLLFGGVPKTYPDGVRVRGDIHVLLIGDPGTGKSLTYSMPILYLDPSKGLQFEYIGKFVDKLLERYKDHVKKNGETEVLDLIELGIEFYVPAINPKTFSVEWKRVKAVIRHKAPDTVVKVRTRSGRELVLTKDHSLLIFKNGQIIPVKPSSILSISNKKVVVPYLRKIPKVKQSDTLVKLNWDIGYFIGRYLGDGSITLVTSGERLETISTAKEALEYLKMVLEKYFGARSETYTYKDNVYRLISTDKSLIEFLKKLTISKPEILHSIKVKGFETKLKYLPPDLILNAPDEFVRGLISGILDSNGYVLSSHIKSSGKFHHGEVVVSMVNEYLVKVLSLALTRLGIVHTIGKVMKRYKDRQVEVYNLRIIDVEKLKQEVRLLEKQDKLMNIERQKTNHIDVIPLPEELIQDMSELGMNKGQLRSKAAEFRAKIYRGYVGREYAYKILNTLMELIGKDSRGITVYPGLHKLKLILDNEYVGWDVIEEVHEISIREVEPEHSDYVYDISVEDYENFVAGWGLVFVHNSQLLRFVAKIAPRAVYTTGKGSSAAGLCIRGDSVVCCSRGIIPIGTLVQEMLKVGEIEIEENIYVSKNPEEINIASVSKDLTTVEVHKAIQYYKIKAKKLLRIRTILGKEIELTPETKVLVYENGKLVWKKACELTHNDHVVLIRKLPDNHLLQEFNLKKFIIENIDDKYFVEIDLDKLNELVKKLEQKFGTLREAARQLGINENKLYYWWKHGKIMPRLKDVKLMCNVLNISIDELLPYIKGLAYKSYRGIEKVRLPDNAELFLEFLGDIYSDGCIIKDERKKESYTIHYSTGSIEEAELYVNRVRQLFNINPSIEVDRRERCYVVKFNNTIVAKILQPFGIPVGKKGKDFMIHPRITILPKKLIAAFLRQLFTGDGGVVENKCVFFSTSSKLMAYQVDMLLKYFGIVSTIRKKEGKVCRTSQDKEVQSGEIYEVQIYDLESLKIFAEHIGFNNSEKKRKLHDLIKRKEELAKRHNNFVKVNDSLIAVKVESIQEVENPEDYVYDLTINDAHSFIANGFIVHNTAAVVKDKLSGDFYLEAGALVLADMGVCIIDEIDKMDAKDRVAMHEALEQQTVSIAKAGIVATLNARCAVLAAANPAFGRYLPNRTVAENVDLPVTLLSRFDLIFIIKDEPQIDRDKKVAEHVTTLHSGEIPEEFKDIIPPDLLRKYIAYARKYVKPILSKEARDKIIQFYTQLRSKSTDSKSPITITARQLEALIRITEAEAKMRLSPIVEIEDVERAIRLFMKFLQSVGIDVETGRIDIDVIMTGKPRSAQEKIATIIDVLTKLEELNGGKPVKLEDLYRECEQVGLDRVTVEKLVNLLIRNGELYMPRPGYVKRVTV